MNQRVLISGASIAGNALAWWLLRFGFDVTVIERAAEFPEGGQNIDVRGAAAEVVRRMGLEQAVVNSGTGEAGLRFVDENGETIGQFDLDEIGPNGPTAELEILRGDLARILYEPCKGKSIYRFADVIEIIETGRSSATVTFRSGRKDTYDIVIVAEGVGSSTRELVFPGENKPRWLDVAMAYFTIPKNDTDDRHCRIFPAGEGRSVWLRPDNKGTTRAILVQQGPSEHLVDLPITECKAFLRDRFADVGWEAPRVLAGMESTEDFYFDALRQVKMDRWSRGRVVLTGDAAWCATPISGMGTTLAIVGAYILAGELATSDDFDAAIRAYEELMRPRVEDGQGVPKFAPRLLQPRTRFGLALQHTVLKVASIPGIKEALGRLLSPKSDEASLPDYEATWCVSRPMMR